MKEQAMVISVKFLRDGNEPPRIVQYSTEPDDLGGVADFLITTSRGYEFIDGCLRLSVIDSRGIKQNSTYIPLTAVQSIVVSR